ncbi:hypothetical protein [Methylobacterium durans]|uniref:Phospholipase A2 domain-containing protein n=1 Tax=Methylobacterium durans TaxID=2202825 RepID=A0A2U8WDZ3_9HYPH|nr:hypothetical protein [Methylobacterium durans]AWN43738.1 hypothetical protein DK389_28515 [Methylobacterium durans]
MVRFALPILLTLGAASPGSIQSAAAQSGPAGRGPAVLQGNSGRGPALLLHGNYCGPGNNGPLAPIDALDAACARHDACTPDTGMASRACNARLQREAETISRDPRQPDDLRALAGLVAVGAEMLPSDTRLAEAPVVAAPRTALRAAPAGPTLRVAPASPALPDVADEPLDPDASDASDDE